MSGRIPRVQERQSWTHVFPTVAGCHVDHHDNRRSVATDETGDIPSADSIRAFAATRRPFRRGDIADARLSLLRTGHDRVGLRLLHIPRDGLLAEVRWLRRS